MWVELGKAIEIALTRASSSSDPMTSLLVSVTESFVRKRLKKLEYDSKSVLIVLNEKKKNIAFCIKRNRKWDYVKVSNP